MLHAILWLTVLICLDRGAGESGVPVFCCGVAGDAL